LRLRVYTDATHFSDSTLFIVPGTNTDADVVFAFADFTTGGGAAGPANFTNVGAIEARIVTSVDGTDGRVTLLGAFGESITTQNIPNAADLSLTKGVNNATPTVGQNVTFTVTLNNAGSAGATNIEVTDLLPAGLTFVSATPSQGSYTSGTGLWTVGNVASAGSAALQIVATVTSTAVLTNTAEVTAADQPDPDSTPDNGVATEDDIATAQVDAPAAAKRAVRKPANRTAAVRRQTQPAAAAPERQLPVVVVENCGYVRTRRCVIREPSLDAKYFCSSTNWSCELMKLTPFTAIAVSFSFIRNAVFVSSGTSNGSRVIGLFQVATTLSALASTTLRVCRIALALAMAIASSATRRADAGSTLLVAANPHAPSTSTRNPMP